MNLPPSPLHPHKTLIAELCICSHQLTPWNDANHHHPEVDRRRTLMHLGRRLKSDFPAQNLDQVTFL
jgi:hypothetical protein